MGNTKKGLVEKTEMDVNVEN
ncbi:MAG: hypothetical protein K0S18_1415, partial [Anaerocolumna sp.]|nr:hypothetical protein [Anaerocolumna sp.]